MPLLHSKNLQKIFSFLVFVLILQNNSWGQTTIHSNTCAAATTGWTYTNGGASVAIQQSGYWLLDDAGDIIISEPFNVSTYTNLTLSFDVATYGSTTNHPCKVEYSTDNGSTWSLTTFTSATPTSTTYITSGVWNIGTIASTQFKLKWTLPTGGNKGVRMKNILFQGTIPAAPPVISSSLTASGTTGTAFSYSITASNSPSSYGATGLPAGLSINTSTGVISGTPTGAGVSNVTITATNASGTDTQTLVITINNPPAPVISSSLTTNGTVGTAFTYTITASNTPTSYNATGLPPGLSINTTTGVISGTPSATGVSNVTITATNAGGTDTQTLVVTINNPPAPVITSSLTASGTTGTAFTYTITATNSPTSYNATGLPAGLSINTSTGVISGTPTGVATTSVTITATNAGGTDTQTLVITVSNPPAPVITSILTASGTTGSAFSYTITASNTPTSYNATGLPAGLSINTGTGLISGTPTAVGTTSVTISATNAGGTGSATLVITISSFTFVAGDYRTNPAFSTTNPSNIIFLNSTVTVGGVAPWQQYNGSAWVDVVHAAGSPNSPMNLATKPPTIYITHGDYTNGIYVDAAGAGTYGNIIVLSGGYLVSFSAGGPTIPTGKNLDIQSGGYIEFAGSGAAPFTLASGSTLTVRDGGTLITNNSTINNTNAMWGGTEDFQDNSTLIIQDWANTGSATVRSLLNPTYQVNTNTSGNSYKFGNIIYNYNPVTNDQTILPALSATLNFCNNLTINNISTTKSISITANQLQSPVARIRGNVTILQGMVNFGINYTNNAKQQLTIMGNIDIQNTVPANPSVVYLHNFGSGITILDRMQIFLEGNLTVASGAVLFTGPAADASSQALTMFNFTGTNAQSINGTGTISLNNVTINKSSQNVTLNRAFGATDSLCFTSGKFILGLNDLTLGDAVMGYQVGGTSTSYAVTDNSGVYKRTVLSNSVSHLFPVGPSLTSYNPATLNYTGTIDDFSARVEVGLNPTTGSDPFFVNRTWNISETIAGGTTATLTLQWENAPTTHENASFVRTNSDIYHYTGGAWVEQTSSVFAGTDPYTSTVGGLTSFSPFSVGKKAVISLPIELLSLSANNMGKTVDLNWATASELNNDYFTIERSVDAVNFQQIKNVDGAGNSTQTLLYSAVDNDPLSGISYYRLKQTDFDGKYSYSKVVSVYIDNNDGFQIVNTFNSIENGSLNVTINCGTNCFLNMELYDMTGKIVFSGDENSSGSQTNISIPTNNLSDGIYLLKIYNGEKIISKKLKL